MTKQFLLWYNRAVQPDRQLTIDDVPEHARSVMDDETLSDLSTEQLHQVCDMMLDLPDGFMAPGAKRGETDITEHGMDMQINAPVKQRWTPWPRAKMEAAHELMQQMREDHVIEPSNSPWASPAVLVTKKDGTIRFCVDYRKVNFLTKKDSYPLPRIDDALNTLALGGATAATILSMAAADGERISIFPLVCPNKAHCVSFSAPDM